MKPLAHEPAPFESAMPRPLTAVAKTLGCKVNQVDSAAILRDLTRAGFATAQDGERADVVIVNACTVTAGADKDARKLISRSREEHPGALVVLTGCLSPDGQSGQDRADLVVTNAGKADLAGAIADRFRLRWDAERKSGSAAFFGGGAVDLTSRARAFLKVQDGCNRNCSYCVIPAVRGPSRSRSIDEIVADALAIRGRGYEEIVVTGVHLGSFGRDLEGRVKFTHLLRALLDRTDLPRIRISSIEPMEVKDDLVDLMAETDRVCRHLHIPLQAGDDEVLRRMRRPYTGGEFRERMERIAECVPGVLIGTDVIVGFPGESEAAFENTLRLLEDAPVHHFHVFPYSQRPGTHAEELARQDGPVEHAVIRERSARLRALAKAKWAAYRRNHVGRTLPALAIQPRDAGHYEALTRNYVPILVRGPFDYGRETAVRVTAWEKGSRGEGLVGECADQASA